MDNYYDTIADSYDGLHGKEQLAKLSLFQRLIAKHHLPIKGTLLDVGSGTGLGASFFREHYHVKTTEVDPSSGLLKRSKGKDKVRAKGESLPFKDHSFDIVLSLTALQNYDDPAKGLEEMKRVSKGLVLLSFLKRSEKKERLLKEIKERFTILCQEEEEKDMLFILKKR